MLHATCTCVCQICGRRSIMRISTLYLARYHSISIDTYNTKSVGNLAEVMGHGRLLEAGSRDTLYSDRSGIKFGVHVLIPFSECGPVPATTLLLVACAAAVPGIRSRNCTY